MRKATTRTWATMTVAAILTAGTVTLPQTTALADTPTGSGDQSQQGGGKTDGGATIPVEEKVEAQLDGKTVPFVKDADTGAWTLTHVTDTLPDTMTVTHTDGQSTATQITLSATPITLEGITGTSSLYQAHRQRILSGSLPGTTTPITLTLRTPDHAWGFALKTSKGETPFTLKDNQWVMADETAGTMKPDQSDTTRTIIIHTPDGDHTIDATAGRVSTSNTVDWSRTWTWTPPTEYAQGATQASLTQTGKWPVTSGQALSDAIGRAETELAKTTWRTPQSLAALQEQYGKAKTLADKLAATLPSADDYPNQTSVDAQTTSLNQALKNMTVEHWDVLVDGVKAGTMDSTGKTTFTDPTLTLGGLPTGHTITLQSTAQTDQQPVTLTPTPTGDETVTDHTPGQVTIQGSARYTLTGSTTDATGQTVQLDALAFTLPYSDVQGTDLDAGTIGFKLSDQNVWEGAFSYDMTVDDTIIGKDGKPIQPVTFNNETLLDASMFGEARLEENGTARFMVRTLTRTGELKVTVHGFDPNTPTEYAQSWRVTANAARSTDTHATPILLDTRADGTVTPVTLPQPDEHGAITVTLPYERSSDTFALTFDQGPEAAVTDQSDRAQGTGRVWQWKDQGQDRSLTLGFELAAIQPDSPARLTGIMVDRHDGQGATLVDGWDPNRLDYTISIGETATSPTITPQWADGVTVAATDVRQTADGTGQTWRVTATANGVSRSYTVTVIRARSWQTTAERFTPRPFVELEGDAAKDPADATLESVGYQAQDGEYVEQAVDRFEIPENGVFAYRLRKGQHASVTKTRLGGMTWRYTIHVLAADGMGKATRTVDVTYLTAATHVARLDGLLVDGQDVDGFKPEVLQYAVAVNDPAQWVVGPVFDRRSGMTVDTVKDGARATVDVTSADGLVKTRYVVDVHQRSLGENVVRLAQTGVAMVAALLGMLVLVGVGVFGWWWSRRLTVDRRMVPDDAVPDDQPDDGTTMTVEDGSGVRPSDGDGDGGRSAA